MPRRGLGALWRRLRPGWIDSGWARRAWLALPLVAGVAVGAGGAAFPPTRDAALSLLNGLREGVLARPEFSIRRLEVTGGEHLSDDEIIAALDLTDERRAALSFDARDARRKLQALGWVKRASVMLRPPHTLVIEIEENRPVFVWRNGGVLSLLDHGGVKIAEIDSRSEAPGLPLIVGPGATASAAMGEARALYEMAARAKLPIVGLSRIGGRRWDLEMLSGPRLMLPEAEPAKALERAVGWVGRAGLLERNFSQVDLRLPYAPVARRAPGPGDLADRAPARLGNRG